MSSFQRSRKGTSPLAKTAVPAATAPVRAPLAGGALQHAGPAPGLAQRKVEIGAADDAFEREADQVARKVSAGEAVAPGEITPLRPGALARAVRPEEKPTAARPMQKAAASAEPRREPVQKAPAAASEKKEPIQKAADTAPKKLPEQPVQRQEEEDEARPSAPAPVQAEGQSAAAAAAAAPTAGMHAAAEQAIAGRGAGTPLAPAVRGPIESSLGADLSHVRVHDDGAARDAADALHARAFAHGSDIWLGHGASPHDLGLMAHEATHVVQQAGGVHRLMRDTKKGPGDAPAGPDDIGAVDEDKKIIVFKKLRVPAFKAKAHRAALYKSRKIHRARGYQRKNPDQTSVWDKSVDTAALRKKIAGIAGVKDGDARQLAISHKSSGYHLIGTLDQMAEAAKRPNWARDGKPRPKDVDHVVELQVSGWHLDTGWPNSAGKTGNMELMDSAANQDSGRRIAADITRKINATRDKWPGATTGKGGKKAPAEATIRKSYELQFGDIDGSIKDAGDPENYWTWSEIAETYKHLESFTAAKADKGGAAAWTLFPTARGGMPKQIEAGKRAPAPAERAWFHPFIIKEIDLAKPGSESGKSIGKISLDLSPEVRKKLDGAGPDALRLTVSKLEALPNAGAVMSDEDVLGMWRKIHAKGLSPIQLRGWDVDPKKGFLAYGSIVTDVPMLQGVSIDFRVEGERVEFFKLFDAGEISLPGPVQITGSSLEVFAGTAGVGVRGDAFFAIEKVGAGRVGAGAKADLKGKPEFEIDGEFSFDSELFDRNKIEAWYRDRQFGAKGLLAIDTPGKVKGIKKAQVDAKYEAGRLDAKGKAELSVPGVKEVDLVLAYSEAEGLSIAGRFELKDDIPGIRGGSGQASVRQKPDGTGWEVTASGKAQPKIPGVDAEIGFAYADGALTVQGRAAYEKGMLKGTLEVGASNRPVGPDGRPAGEPGTKFTAWGGGNLTLRLAPWLQAGVGVRLLPNGEVEVQGNIGLPAAIDLFPEKKLTKNLFTIGIDIPIVGVAVAGQRIGIFANISGGLDLDAGFGPGQLTKLGLAVTYNPAHEEQTTVSGGATLKVPAHAGLRLFVQGSVGVGIPIVSARAGLEVGGALGIEGALEAAVQVDWSPAKGLKLSAVGEIYAEPKLRFDITGFVKVEADLWVTTIDLYDKRWQLAAFEYGSGLRLGVRFPITYEEGKAFDVSFDQMQFQIPKIEPKALLSDLIARIA